MMTNTRAFDLAKKARNDISWADEELSDTIHLYELVIAFCEGRGDCGIIMVKLRSDLETFRQMREARRKR